MITQRRVSGSIGILVLLMSMIMIAPDFNFAQAQNDGLVFVENVGQFDNESSIRFQANLGQTTLSLADDAIWFTVLESLPVDPPTEADFTTSNLIPNLARRGVNIKLTFPNATPQPQLEPFNRLDSRVSYFNGSDPNGWQVDVPVWGGVRYVDLYPNVDLEITGENGQLTQRLIVREAEVSAAQSVNSLEQVQWQVEGADNVRLENNQLYLSTALGEFRLPLLEVGSVDNLAVELAGAEAQVEGAVVSAPFATSAFETEIDAPVGSLAGSADLLFSTFLGGEGDFDYGFDIAIDDQGYTYITGQATTGFPATPGVFDSTVNGDNDVFIAKLTPNGSDLVFATFIGGSDWETPYAIQVDNAGDITIAGHTTSPDWPTTTDAIDDTLDGGSDAYVAKINSTGTALLYSTLLGGLHSDFGLDMVVDDQGIAYVTGSASDGFPTTPDALNSTYRLGDAFVVKLALDSRGLLYSTYLGGSSFDTGNSIAVDDTGIYVGGRTGSEDFPVTADAFDKIHERIEGFVAKLSLDGTNLIYATMIGGDDVDEVEAIDIDDAGHVYVTGNTRSPNFPTTPDAFAPTCSECATLFFAADSFVSKLSVDGSSLVYSSYLGGNLPDYGHDIAVSENGRAYIAGYTYSPDFPVTADAFDTVCEGCDQTFEKADVFVVRVNPSGTALEYGTYLGGDDGSDLANAMAADNDGNVYVTGFAHSTNFPTTEGVFDSTLEGYYDVFVSKLATGSDDPEPEPTPTPTPTPTPVHTCGPTPLGEITVGDTPRGIAVDSSRNRAYVANFGSDSVSVIDGSTNTVLHTITGITSANGLAYDSTNDIIWVSNYELDLLTPIQAADDPADFFVHGAVEVGDGPWGVAYNPVNNYVYVVNNLDNSVTMVNAATREVLTTLTDTFNQPFHLAVNTVSGKVYVANSGHNSVTVIDGASIDSVAQLWDSGRAYGIAVDELRDVVYVATIETNRIVVLGTLNGQDDQFLGWALFQRGYNPNRRIPLRAIAVNPNIGSTFDGGHVWATTSTGDGSEADQALFIPKGWSSRFHVPFAQDVGTEPTEGIAIDRVNNWVYISSGTSPGMVTVIGDHETICGGIAPASVDQATNDPITFEIFSVDNVTQSDLNNDGEVNVLDLVIVAARFGTDDPVADVNGDRVVDILDLTFIGGNFGKKLLRNEN